VHFFCNKEEFLTFCQGQLLRKCPEIQEKANKISWFQVSPKNARKENTLHLTETAPSPNLNSTTAVDTVNCAGSDESLPLHERWSQHCIRSNLLFTATTRHVSFSPSANLQELSNPLSAKTSRKPAKRVFKISHAVITPYLRAIVNTPMLYCELNDS